MERWPSRITTVQSPPSVRPAVLPLRHCSSGFDAFSGFLKARPPPKRQRRGGEVGPVRCFCGAPPNGAFQHTPRQSICSLRNRLTRRNIYLQLLRRLFLFPKATPQRLCDFPYNNQRGMPIRPISVALSTHFMDWIDISERGIEV